MLTCRWVLQLLHHCVSHSIDLYVRIILSTTSLHIQDKQVIYGPSYCHTHLSLRCPLHGLIPRFIVYRMWNEYEPLNRH